MPAPDPVPAKPRLSHRFEYAGVLGVGAVVNVLPERIRTVFLESLGGMAGGLLRVRRDVVDENLERAFPELTVKDRNRIAVASYRHLTREGGLLLGSTVRPMTAESMRARTHWGDDDSRSTFEWLRGRAARKESTIVLTGHLGNWEMAGAVMASFGIPVKAVAVAQRNPLFDRRIRSTRHHLGLTLISRDDAMRDVPKAIRAGSTVALVADQHSQRGVRVDFFGHPVQAARGPAVFALRSQAPAALGLLVRDPGWPPRYSAFIERLSYTPTGVAATDIAGWTASYLAGLERYVRRFPEQYLWMHKRWRD